SSTTRHVFILGLQLHQIPTGMFSFQVRSSCRHQVRHDFENAIDIEHDHQLGGGAVNPAGELGHAGVEIDGVFLAAVIVEFQDLADLVDQQAVGLAAQIDANRHRRLAVVVLGQAQASAHVDHGDDAAAQIEHAGNL